VPFHLGPRLRADRCVLDKSQGLITCDYVVGAETLRDGIRDGRGVHVIGNLPDPYLMAPRRHREQRPLQEFLLEHLHERGAIPRHRERLIRGYGAIKTLEELKAQIAQASPSRPVLVGTIHGDLHATNVLVRMNDAVIIDLERIAAGQPLLLDAASLEGGLFVDGFVGDRRSAKEVLASILPLYTTAALKQDDHYCDPASGSAWFVDSVRQARAPPWLQYPESGPFAPVPIPAEGQPSRRD
jgi:Phosphotransferase enzyme family